MTEKEDIKILKEYVFNWVATIRGNGFDAYTLTDSNFLELLYFVGRF